MTEDILEEANLSEEETTGTEPETETIKGVEVFKKVLKLKKPSDVRVFCQGVVWAIGDDELYYALPSYSYGQTLLKLPKPPKKLTIYCNSEIRKVEILDLNPDRRT